ncbi:hypothetical protein DFJ74DRAFT_710272 [Hyaloraphidium curvatum]|nr:hypothetical protein DFJ74DRAFT_710272 [Hyaloraphidium curvatum]
MSSAVPPLDPPARRRPRTVLGVEMARPALALAVVDACVVSSGLALWTYDDLRGAFGAASVLLPLACAASIFSPRGTAYSPAIVLALCGATLAAGAVAAALGLAGMALAVAAPPAAAMLVLATGSLSAVAANAVPPVWGASFAGAFVLSAAMTAVGFSLRPPFDAMGQFPVSLLRSLSAAVGVIIFWRLLVGPLLGTPSNASRFRQQLDDATAAIDANLAKCAARIAAASGPPADPTVLKDERDGAAARLGADRRAMDALLETASMVALETRFVPGPLAALGPAAHQMLLAAQFLEVESMQAAAVAALDRGGEGAEKWVLGEVAGAMQEVLRTARMNLRAARSAILGRTGDPASPEPAEVSSAVREMDSQTVASLRAHGFDATDSEAGVVFASTLLVLSTGVAWAASAAQELARTAAAGGSRSWCACMGRRRGKGDKGVPLEEVRTNGTGSTGNGSAGNGLPNFGTLRRPPTLDPPTPLSFTLPGPDPRSPLVIAGRALSHESARTAARAVLSFTFVLVLAQTFSLPSLSFINAFIGASFVFSSVWLGKANATFLIRVAAVLPGLLISWAGFAASGGYRAAWTSFGVVAALAAPFAALARLPGAGAGAGIVAVFAVSSYVLYPPNSPPYATYIGSTFAQTALGALVGLLSCHLVGPKLAADAAGQALAAAGHALAFAVLRMRVVRAGVERGAGDGVDRAAAEAGGLADSVHACVRRAGQAIVFSKAEPRFRGPRNPELVARMGAGLRMAATLVSAWADAAAGGRAAGVADDPGAGTVLRLGTVLGALDSRRQLVLFGPPRAARGAEDAGEREKHPGTDAIVVASRALFTGDGPRAILASVRRAVGDGSALDSRNGLMACVDAALGVHLAALVEGLEADAAELLGSASASLDLGRESEVDEELSKGPFGAGRIADSLLSSRDGGHSP